MNHFEAYHYWKKQEAHIRKYHSRISLKELCSHPIVRLTNDGPYCAHCDTVLNF